MKHVHSNSSLRRKNALLQMKNSFLNAIIDLERTQIHINICKCAGLSQKAHQIFLLKTSIDYLSQKNWRLKVLRLLRKFVVSWTCKMQFSLIEWVLSKNVVTNEIASLSLRSLQFLQLRFGWYVHLSWKIRSKKTKHNEIVMHSDMSLQYYQKSGKNIITCFKSIVSEFSQMKW